MRRARSLRQLGAALLAAISATLLSSCGAIIVSPGYTPSVGPDEGLVLVNLWDQSCKKSTAEPAPGPKPSCDFSGAIIVATRVAGPNGEKAPNTEEIHFSPGYRLLVLPTGTWKLTRLEWTIGDQHAELHDRKQFLVAHGVVSDWGAIGLERMNVRSSRFVREPSPRADAQAYLTKNWPELKTMMVDGVAGPGEVVRTGVATEERAP